MNSTIVLPSFAGAFVLLIAVLAIAGHIIYEWSVRTRYNFGALLGGIFGFLAIGTIGSVFAGAPQVALIGLLMMVILTILVVQLPRRL